MNRLLLFLIGGSYVALAVYKILTRQPKDTMSFSWLNEQERESIKHSAAIDGPAWKWPVDKERAS